MRFKIDWASLQWEGNLPFFLCFTLYSRTNSKNKPPGGLCSEGRFNGGLLRYDFGGLKSRGPYTWRGLFSEFTVMQWLFWGETVITKCLGMGWL